MKKAFVTRDSSARTKIPLRRLCLALLLFLAGFGAGFAADRFIPANTAATAYPVREKSSATYKFIDPLLAFETPESNTPSALASLKHAINSLIARHIRSRDAEQISVYVRGLNSGRWISVNPEERYNPASLLKVPTMMAFFKLAESQPDVLSKSIVYTGAFDDNNAEHFKSPHALEPGKSYTVEQLIEAMITYSDNNATRLLHDAIKPEIIQKVYDDLGISVPGADSAGDFMTISQYTYFFRVLYNATYLDRPFSELALKLLSEPDFPQGIQSGVPATAVLAQKFGERTIVDPDSHAVTARELHDCGIVYYPAHPYLLCVMTRGNDFDRLASVIQDISRTVWRDRADQYHK